ncbi:hypothetical protein GCM10007972_12130 [Iodidimonas muriae]|uniref:Lipoprotein n=1 Tax=Iodidimonas muriae TaxID=261467 RepID=A0ABQ2LCB1_9PROT|nr:hypothetical protein [Iodidimonas muriae]GER06789.1 hypothetical protein JCM17843_10990 [Kordiimonadales bacterium JCM 17843]GGO09957.1 hypothetical protein GCM10007972_12130 [Iodidimonas muriae]
MAQHFALRPGFILRTASLALLAFGLSGCSWFSSDKDVDPIFADLPMGPDTRSVAKQLPDGLPGDTENERHMRSTMAPKELAPNDGQAAPN